jgi:hypothetical protein
MPRPNCTKDIASVRQQAAKRGEHTDLGAMLRSTSPPRSAKKMSISGAIYGTGVSSGASGRWGAAVPRVEYAVPAR